MIESGKKPPLDQVIKEAEARRKPSDNPATQKVDNIAPEKEKDKDTILNTYIK